VILFSAIAVVALCCDRPGFGDARRGDAVRAFLSQECLRGRRQGRPEVGTPTRSGRSLIRSEARPRKKAITSGEAGGVR